MTILSKAVKPCKFKMKGISLTVLKVTNCILILNVKSMRIHLLPSQHYRCLDLGTRTKNVPLIWSRIFSVLLLTFPKLFNWQSLFCPLLQNQFCEELVKLLRVSSYHLILESQEHITPEQSVSFLGCCFEVHFVDQLQDKLIAPVGIELII